MKNIDLELYKVFYEVGKYKNITKAASSLFISQPAITQQIKKLEAQLNYKLFYRTKYGVEFTAEGKKIFNDISNSMQLLEHIPESLDKMNDIIKTLRFSASFGSTRMILYPKIKEIFMTYPDIDIEINKDSNEKIVQGLLENYIDIGIINDKSLNKENIAYFKTAEIETIFVASKKYVEKTNLEKITMKNITELPLLLIDKTSATRKIFENFLIEKCITVKPKFDVSSYEVIIDLIRDSLGVSVMNKTYIKKYLDSGEIVEIKSDIKLSNRKLYIAINKSNLNNEFIKDVVNILLE